jgi:hypothetical protein
MRTCSKRTVIRSWNRMISRKARTHEGGLDTHSVRAASVCEDARRLHPNSRSRVELGFFGWTEGRRFLRGRRGYNNTTRYRSPRARRSNNPLQPSFFCRDPDDVFLCGKVV